MRVLSSILGWVFSKTVTPNAEPGRWRMSCCFNDSSAHLSFFPSQFLTRFIYRLVENVAVRLLADEFYQ